jgi:hypothetical protein
MILYLISSVLSTTIPLPRRDLCGTDDSIQASCLFEKIETAPFYEKSKAVLRMSMKGYSHCTAWFIGDEGHIITNYHCIEDGSWSSYIQFEAMGEQSTCDTGCSRIQSFKQLRCFGSFVHSKPLEWIATGGSVDFDFSLLRLPLEDREAAKKFGHLKLRRSGPVVGERIYVPGHPMGMDKRIAYKDGDEYATILALNRRSECDPSGGVVYRADTQTKSSGSPVIGMDNLVVGIHHCGDCSGSQGGNSAIHVDKIIAKLGKYLPDSAFE